jgi:hypothetical protein
MSVPKSKKRKKERKKERTVYTILNRFWYKRSIRTGQKTTKQQRRVLI